MKEIAALINSNRGLFDNLAKVFEIERKVGLEHSVTRRWSNEYDLIYDTGKTPEPMKCWLFSDCIVCSKSLKKVDANIKLLEIENIVSDPTGVSICCGSITHKFQTQEPDKWIQQIQEAKMSAARHSR